MSTLEAAGQELDTPLAAASGLSRLGNLVQSLGDRMNPILVKETRQALKSRQFGTTFALLLLAGWLWSLFGIALIGPAISYTARGADLFVAYYTILAFPLLVIVPYSALRSLAVEREDGTYELMSVTTLRPRQIVAGKLGSAAVQTIVYLSAISPFLAFTYLLRGIDFFTILYVTGCLVLASMGLSAIGLLLATLARERHWQAALSVAFIAGLLWVFGVGVATVGNTAYSPLGFRESWFWTVNLALLSAYASAFVLVFLAAAAQITFPHDNRSTALRIAVFVEQALLAAWMVYLILGRPDDWHYAALWLVLATGLGYATGVFFTSESPVLSPRVRRALPRSLLGRMATTWLNPGPATGFWFTVANLAAHCAMVAAMAMWIEFTQPAGIAWSKDQRIVLFEMGVLLLSYLIVYLGLGAWIVRWLRRWAPIAPALPLMIQVLIVLVLVGLPLVVHLSSPFLRNMDYSALQVFNPGWTFVEIERHRGIPGEAGVWILAVPLAAIVILGLNLPGAALELRQGRVAAPPRVAEEEAQAAAQRAPRAPARQSPWD